MRSNKLKILNLKKMELEIGFPMGRDKGKEFPSLSRDNGTSSKSCHGTGRAGTVKIRDGTRDKTGQGQKGCSKTGKGCSKTEKDVLKQEKML